MRKPRNYAYVARLLLLIASIAFVACGHRVELDELTPAMTYMKLQKSLTTSAVIDLGKWRVTRVYATLLHKAMASYRSDLPKQGIGIEFFTKGFESNFVVQNITLIISDGKGRATTIVGLGTDHLVISGDLADQKSAVEYLPLGKITTKHGDFVNQFRLVLPIELNTDLSYLEIKGQDIYNSKIRFSLKWKFV